MTQPTTPEQPAPAGDARTTVMRSILGGMAAQVVATTTKLGIADALGESTVHAADLAQRCDVSVQPMRRLLRALAALGLCAEQHPDQFALTEAGGLLRRDHPRSLHGFARMFTDPAMLGAWNHLDTAVHTGEPQFAEIFGVPFFDHLAGQPELSALFNASMSQATRAVAASLPDHYNFDRYSVVADVGGGDGSLLSAILTRNAHLRGFVYDTPEGAAQAVDTISAAELSDRCDVVHGDFFHHIPAGADLVLLKSILHDWNDDAAGTILHNCHAVLPEHGRLLIIEPVLPEVVPEDARAGIYLSDLNMLVNIGGRERTSAEFTELCERSGFAITRIDPLPQHVGFFLIEAAPEPVVTPS
ncbi:methyltransferase [Phytoactinopolyspora endophytica]|uniref:methyltransferase n=1 Tax=Phytoactinopolyspora endophytica TaxID=1642495 RepID=UPI00101D354B|nr:methyltransferase [Phytoactinopolyspora endophytica]